MKDRKSCHWHEPLMILFIEYSARGVSVKLHGLVIFVFSSSLFRSSLSARDKPISSVHVKRLKYVICGKALKNKEAAN